MHPRERPTTRRQFLIRAGVTFCVGFARSAAGAGIGAACAGGAITGGATLFGKTGSGICVDIAGCVSI